MGLALFDRIRWAATVAAPARPLASPWSPSTLSTLVVADIIGASPVPSRGDAMRVPSIVKGRALIAKLATSPLGKWRGADRLDPDPWMYRTNTGQSPYSRMLWTLDDLIFGGLSLWAVQRGSGASSPLLDAGRVPPEWWEIDADLKILVNGRQVSAEEVVLIEGPQEGLCRIAAEHIDAARAQDRAWSKRVKSPVPLIDLHTTDANENLTEVEATELVERWEIARANGGTAYTPYGLEAKSLGDTPTDLFVQGRNALRLDIANFLNLPAALLDGSPSTASLTYSTKDGARNEFADYSLDYWAAPIEARLSQDDITPRGTRVAFQPMPGADPAATTDPAPED